MKIKVDANKCIGCGVCEAMCEKCFKVNGNVAEVLQDLCEDCNLDDVVASCPVEAISVEK